MFGVVCCFCCCCCLVLFLVCSPLQICRVSILSHDDLCTPHTWRPNSCQKKLACFKNSQTSGIPARRQSMLNILLPLSQSASQSGLLLPLWKVCLSVTPVAKLFLESSPQTRGALLPSPPFGGGIWPWRNCACTPLTTTLHVSDPLLCFRGFGVLVS